MIMEDASVTALLHKSLTGSLPNRIGELENSAASITAIVRAARALLDG
ncbi:MAG: hypothetical protein M3448_04605 [Pseudomonadota bacterium]|nr:hypothetical protein [Pseudomonadota bacterium]